MPDRRKDVDQRMRINEVRNAQRRTANMLYWGMIIFGAANLVAIILAGIALRKIHDESNSRFRAINQSRVFNTTNLCLSDSDKNGVLRQFVLYAVRGDKNQPLYLEAVRVFPLKDRAKCEAEAKRKIHVSPR